TFDNFRDTFLAHLNAGRVGPDGAAPERTDLAPMVTALDIRLSASRAAEFRARLKELLEEYDNFEPEGTDTVPVELLCVFSSPRQSTDSQSLPGLAWPCAHVPTLAISLTADCSQARWSRSGCSQPGCSQPDCSQTDWSRSGCSQPDCSQT